MGGGTGWEIKYKLAPGSCYEKKKPTQQQQQCKHDALKLNKELMECNINIQTE